MPKRKTKRAPKTKVCKRCGKRRKAAEFHRDKTRKDGLRTWCKSCTNEYHRDRVEADPLGEFIRSLVGSARARSKAKKMDFSLTAECVAEMYEAQAGRCSVTGIEMSYIRYDGKHATNLSIDRINNDRGYTPDNIRLVCSNVNRMRGQWSDVELIWWCRLVVDNCTADMDTVTDHAAPIEPLGDIDLHGDY